MINFSIDDLINGFFRFLMSFVIGLFNLIMTPIDYLLKSLLPYIYEDFIEPINNLLNSFISFVPFIADLTFLPAFVLHLIVSFLIFKYTAKFTVFSIKLIVKWWNYLKG